MDDRDLAPRPSRDAVERSFEVFVCPYGSIHAEYVDYLASGEMRFGTLPAVQAPLRHFGGASAHTSVRQALRWVLDIWDREWLPAVQADGVAEWCWRLAELAVADPFTPDSQVPACMLVQALAARCSAPPGAEEALLGDYLETLEERTCGLRLEALRPLLSAEASRPRLAALVFQPDAAGRFGRTPLCRAAATGRWGLVELFKDCGGDLGPLFEDLVEAVHPSHGPCLRRDTLRSDHSLVRLVPHPPSMTERTLCAMAADGRRDYLAGLYLERWVCEEARRGRAFDTATLFAAVLLLSDDGFGDDETLGRGIRLLVAKAGLGPATLATSPDAGARVLCHWWDQLERVQVGCQLLKLCLALAAGADPFVRPRTAAGCQPSLAQRALASGRWHGLIPAWCVHKKGVSVAKQAKALGLSWSGGRSEVEHALRRAHDMLCPQQDTTQAPIPGQDRDRDRNRENQAQGDGDRGGGLAPFVAWPPVGQCAQSAAYVSGTGALLLSLPPTPGACLWVGAPSVPNPAQVALAERDEPALALAMCVSHAVSVVEGLGDNLGSLQVATPLDVAVPVAVLRPRQPVLPHACFAGVMALQTQLAVDLPPLGSPAIGLRATRGAGLPRAALLAACVAAFGLHNQPAHWTQAVCGWRPSAPAPRQALRDLVLRLLAKAQSDTALDTTEVSRALSQGTHALWRLAERMGACGLFRAVEPALAEASVTR